jgi:gliding motility-associated-like protein
MKRFLLSVNILILTIFLQNFCFASHLSGGDITYTCIGPNQYEITFKLYRDCSGITVPTTIAINFSNTCGLANPATLNVTLRNPSTGVVCTAPCATEVSQLCPSQVPNSTCNGGTLPGMQEYIYKGTVTFPGQCNSWTMSHGDGSRNNSVNVTSSSTQNYYFEAVLKTVNAPCNNSPTFSAQPIPYLCAGYPVSYNLATIEPDGDSLNYTLIAAKSAAGTPVPYNAGYSGSSPLTGITINNSTGQLNFTPTTIGNFIVVVQVEEFNAAGLSVGTVYRDFQFVIQSCSNTPPDPTSGTISGFSGTALQTGSYSIQMCEGQNFSFNASYTDPDALNNLTFTTNVTSVLSGSTYTNTTGGNPLNASFSWTAPAGTGGQTLGFVVTIGDGACPIPGINTFTYTINVITSTTAGPNRYYCPAGGPIQLSAAGGTNFNWAPSSGLSCTNCAAPLASPSATTTYTVTSNLASGCINSATVTVFNVPNFNLTVSNDTTICRNNAAALSAIATPSTFAPYQYSWTPSYALSSTNTANTSASPQYTNTYYVAVTSNTGCRIKDSVKVIISGNAPVIYTSSNDYLVCPGTQVQLTTSFMQPCGIVNYPCTGPASNVQIGNGMYADSYSTTPFYGGNFSASKHQYIYTAAEIATILGGAAGGKNISALSFNLSGVPSVTPAPLPPVAPTAYINIKIGCTTQGEFTTYTANFVQNLIPVKTNYLFSPVNGWNTITLDNVYRWDGSSDIIVEVCTNIGFSSSIPAIYTSTYPKYYTLYKNSSATDTSSMKGCSALVGTRSSSRTDIRFSMCNAVPTAGYNYAWTPSTGLSNAGTPNPTAVINNDITYQVVVTDLANPQCKGIDEITIDIDSTNYVTATPDTSVCPGTTVQLNAIVTGPPPSSSIPCGTNNTNCSGTPYLATIGTGTTFNTQYSYPAPYGNYYWGAKHQILYTAAELQAAGMQSGTISELAFNVAALNGGTTSYQNVQIKMGCSTLSSLSTWQTGLSTVYTNANYTVTTGWNTHVFTNKFDWDGVSSIIVEFCFNNASYQQNISTYWTTTTNNSVIRYIADNSTVCATSTYATPDTKRPNTRFKTCNAPPVFLAYSWAPAAAVSNPNIANPTALINANSTFTVTVTGTACTVSDVVTVNIGSTTPTITASGPLVFCQGGSVTLTSSAATGNTWSNGATTQSITVTSSGIYTVTNSCGITSAPITVTVSPTPVVTVNSPVICPGQSATLTGNGAASYVWSTGVTVNPITVSPTVTTSYTVTGTSNGCSGTAIGTVTVNPGPAISVNSPTICAGQSATLTASGATTYLWSTGSSANAITVSPAVTTSYTVTGTTSGCSGSTVATVTVNPLPNTTVNSAVICSGQSANLTAAGATTYLWSTGSTANPITVSPLSTTSYTVTGTMNSCSKTAVGTVTVNPVPTVSVNSQSICSGASATITATPSLAGGTYLWSPGGASSQSISVSPASTTTYSVTYSLNGCSNTGSGIVTVNPRPTATMSGGGTICAGNTSSVNINFTGPSPWTFTYSDGTVNNTISGVTVSPYVITTGTSGNYSLVSVSNATCTGTFSGSAIVTVRPLLAVSNITSVCNASNTDYTVSFAISGGDPSTYIVTGGGGTISSGPPYTFTSFPIPAGSPNYSFIANDASNCSPQQVNGTQNCNCSATATMSGGGVICAGGSTTLNVALTGTSPWSIVYTDGTTNIPVNGITSSPYVITTGSAGNYSMVSVSDANCIGSSGGSAIVTVNSAPSVSVNSPVICEGETANITATPGSSGGTYSWTPGGAATQTLSVTPAATTSYTVTYTLNGCSNTSVSNVTVNSLPVVTVNNEIICEGASATLTANGGTSYLWSDGSSVNPLVVSPVTTTTYTVTGTSNGCSSTAIASVTVNSTLTVTVNSVNICEGESSTLTATGGASYSWSGGEITNPIIVSPAATTSYTVTATSNGCSNTAVATVTVNPVPSVTVNSPTICEGTSATLTATTSSSGGDYLWNPGGIAIQSISVSPATSSTYTVSYTLNGCTSSAVSTVTVNSLPVVSVNSFTICEGQSATLTAGGAADYIWSNGDIGSTVNVSPLATTSYTVTGSTNGCSSSAMSIVTVNPIPVVSVNSVTICQGQTSNLTASGGNTYSWSTGDITNPITVSPAVTTSYTVTGTTSGCSATAISTVTVNPMPVVTVNSETICTGATAALTASTSSVGGNFVWLPGNASTQAINVNPVSSTTYTVTYTLNSCSTTALSTVTVNNTPSISVNSMAICDGTTATLTATGGTSYSWSTGDLTGSITVSPSTSSSYTVTGSSNGCSGTAVSIVSVNAVPILSVNPDTMCAGTSATLSANPSVSGGTFLWSPGNASTSTINVSPSSTTTYSVSYSLNGCTSNATGTVTVNALPIIDPISDVIGCTNTTIPAGSFTSNPSGATYAWINTNTVIGLAANGSVNVPAFNANNPGSTPLIANIEVTPFLNGCSGPSEAYTITIHPDPFAVISGGGLVCNGSVANVNINLTGTAPFNLIYTNGVTNNTVNGLTSSGYSFSSSDTGVYSVISIADAYCYGSASGSAVIDNYPPLQVSVSGNTSLCAGSTTTLTATASGGDGIPYAYLWGVGGSDGSGNTLNVSPTSNTYYFVSASDGCTGAVNDTIDITILPSPNVVFNSNLTSGCAPLCVNLTESCSLSGGSVTSWSWNLAAAGNSTAQNPSACFNSPGIYSIGLTATGTNGCSSTFVAANMITVNALPEAEIIAPSTISMLDPLVHFNSNSVNATQWLWDFGDVNSQGNNNTSTLKNPSHIYSLPGSYCATLTVQSSAGCIDVTQYCVEVEEEFSFYIPNAFSPNGDGLNDVFYPKGNNISEYQMSIYDRWGNLVFFTDSPDKPWDGKRKNSEEAILMDVYVYKINVREGEFKKFHNYIGTVTIVK